MSYLNKPIPGGELRCEYKSGSSVGYKIHKGNLEVLAELLSALECRGIFLIRPQGQVKWTAPAKLKVIRLLGQGVMVRVKHGDNGTAHEYDVVPPTTIDPSILCEQMRDRIEKRSGPETPEVIAAMTEARQMKQLPLMGEALTNNLVRPLDPMDMVGMFHRLQKITERVANRKQRLELLASQRQARLDENAIVQKKIDDLRQEQVGITASIRQIEAEELALMEEDEKDTDAKAAVEMFSGMKKIMGG